MKKIISLFLSLVMIISAVCIADFSALAEDKPIMAKAASLYSDNESGSDTMIEDTLYYADVTQNPSLFAFIPETSGYYCFCIFNEYVHDFVGAVLDADGNVLKETDYRAPSAMEYAKVNLTAGKLYYLGIAGVNKVGRIEFGVLKCKSISNAEAKLSFSWGTYNGSAKKPTVTVLLDGEELKKDFDYTVSYSNNVNAGTATVKISGIKAYTGAITKTFTIKPKTLTTCTVKDVTYTGKALFPSVYSGSKKLTRGTDYSIAKISKNTYVGTASVTIRFLGNYSGTITKTFKVLPKNVTGIKLTKRTTSSISVSWSKVSGATGYKIYKYDTAKKKYVLSTTTSKTSCTVSGSAGKSVKIKVCSYKTVNKTNYISTGKEYTNITTPSKATISKLTKPAKGKINCYISTKGYYEFQFSTSKSFKSKKSKSGYINDVKNEYYCVTGAASGRTYYFRARKYVYDKNGNKIYGAWSTVKYTKAK